MESRLTDNTINEMLEFKLPRYSELPKLALYKEQVIIYIERVLKPIQINTNEKLLTPTMLNNYVKQKVISAPQSKKYTEKHIAYLIVVCILKNVYTLNEICELIQFQINTCSIDQAYDYFCVELENSINAIFSTRELNHQNTAILYFDEGEIVRSTILSFVHKLYIQKLLNENL